jgi:SAM-dependent methyltransferase
MTQDSDTSRATPPIVAARLVRIRDGRRRPVVLDLGCGSGIFAKELSRAGCDVIGIDQSEAMLKIARRRAPRATFRRRSFLDASLPQDCDAVVAIGEVFNFLFDARNRGARSLARVFRQVAAALRTGGLFIFDIATPGRSGGTGKRQKHSEGKDWAILVETDEDAARKLIRRIVSFRRVGRLYRRTEELHRLRLYRPAEVARLLRHAGFEFAFARGYGSFRLPSSGWMTVIATKVALTRAARAAARRSARSTR